MAIRYDQAQTREQLGVAVQQFQLSPLGDWREVIGPKHVRLPNRWILGVFPCRPLDVVCRLGKRRHHVAHPVHARCATRVREVQMRQYHGVDVPGPQSQRFEASHEPAGHQAIHLFVPQVVLGPNPRVHQYLVATALQQQAIQPHGEPVLPVGRDQVLPHYLGNPAENRPAIHLEHAIADYHHAGC